MEDRAARPAATVAFVCVLALIVAAIIIHADDQHSGSRQAPLGAVPSNAYAATSRATPISSTSSSAHIPTPRPHTLSVGPALCGPHDYVLKRHTEHQSATKTQYDLTATYTGTSHCLLIDYPEVTVAASGSARRELHPAGGVIQGYGQPPATTLTPEQPARSYLLVQGNTCTHPSFDDVRMDGFELVARLSTWCSLYESPWLQLHGAGPLQATAAQGTPQCKPYDLKLSPLGTPKKVGADLRYTLTVTNKTEVVCAFSAFPRVTAVAPDGSLHELTVAFRGPTPQLELDVSGSATTYLQVPTKQCTSPTLQGVRLENLPVGGTHGLTLTAWCSITESYWRLTR